MAELLQIMSNSELSAAIETAHSLIRSSVEGDIESGLLTKHLETLLSIEQSRARYAHYI